MYVRTICYEFSDIKSLIGVFSIFGNLSDFGMFHRVFRNRCYYITINFNFLYIKSKLMSSKRGSIHTDWSQFPTFFVFMITHIRCRNWTWFLVLLVFKMIVIKLKFFVKCSVLCTFLVCWTFFCVCMLNKQIK